MYVIVFNWKFAEICGNLYNLTNSTSFANFTNLANFANFCKFLPANFANFCKFLPANFTNFCKFPQISAKFYKILQNSANFQLNTITYIYIMLFFYVLFEVFPFCKGKKLKWYKHRSVITMILIGITSLFYCILCIISFMVKQLFINNYNNRIYHLIFTKIYTLILLIPHKKFFIILIFFSFACFLFLSILCLLSIDNSSGFNR